MIEEFIHVTRAKSPSFDKKSSLKFFLAHPDIVLKKFDNHYKVLQVFDNEESIMQVKCYKSLKKFTAIKTEMQFKETQITSMFNSFRQSKEFIETMDDAFLLKHHEFFVDNQFFSQNKIIVYQIFEKMDYPLFNSNHPLKNHLMQKHVIKHFNENEIIKILHGLISFFQVCEFSGKKPHISNALICFSKGCYKLLIRGFEEMAIIPSSQIIFGNEQSIDTNIVHQNSPVSSNFTNKLEIQKSSHRTADTINKNDCQTSSKIMQIEKIKHPSINYYKYAVSMCSGLFKDMAFAFFGVNSENNQSLSSFLSKDKFSKFGNLLEMFEKINNNDSNTIDYQTVDEWNSKMTDCIDNYFESYFSFKNQEVLLLNQPIFSDMKNLRLELSHDLPNIHTLLAFMIKELQKMRKLTSIEYQFNDCLLNSAEINALVKPLEEMKSLNKIIIKLCHNNFDGSFINHLAQILNGKKLETFDISLCEFDKKN